MKMPKKCKRLRMSEGSKNPKAHSVNLQKTQGGAPGRCLHAFGPSLVKLLLLDGQVYYTHNKYDKHLFSYAVENEGCSVEHYLSNL